VTAGLATEAELQARHDWFIALVDLLKVRSRTIDDIVRQAAPYMRDPVEYDPEAMVKQWKDRPGTAELLSRTRHTLSLVEQWDMPALEEALRSLAERLGLTAGKIFQPLRVALTGLTVSPGIFDVLRILGRERALARIDDALTQLRS